MTNWWIHLVQTILNNWTSDKLTKNEKWRMVQVEVDLPDHYLYELLDWDNGTTAHYSWMPIREMEVLGFGAATLVKVSGRDAVGSVQQQFASFDLPTDACNWLGGFAFDATVPMQGIWDKWHHALWFVPNLLLRRKASSTRVDVLYIDSAEKSATDVQSMLEGFMQGNTTTSVEPSGGEIGREHTYEEWTDMINEAVARIATGELQKVALARQAKQPVTKPLAGTLHSLFETYHQNYVFAMQYRGKWFIGASPEQLVRAEAGELFVDCLAGSIQRGATDEEDAHLGEMLLRSEKNLEEHKAVVRFITDHLKVAADDIEYPHEPELKRLANVQHLYTPVRARLKSGIHVLDAAKVLHPTPAVGGTPRAEAVSFIREHEGWNRGYYAGGVGAIFGEQDGLIHVGLRSALVVARTAYLFAGCGIVRGSNPEEEWQESELKFMAMRSAFGERGV